MSEANRRAASNFVIVGDVAINLDHVVHVDLKLQGHTPRVVIHYDIVVGDEQVSVEFVGAQAEKVAKFFRQYAGGTID